MENQNNYEAYILSCNCSHLTLQIGSTHSATTKYSAKFEKQSIRVAN